MSDNSRGKKLAKNTGYALLFQVCTVISGFVIPRLILVYYGSDVNGLVSSITQFIQVIAFLELGVGAVVQSALYKSLAEKNRLVINQIITSAEKFFRKIGIILLCYVVLLLIFFPFFSNQDFSFLYTATLIVAMSISFFSQYYFGIVDQLLLNADQRGYIFYITQTITIALTTVICGVLIVIGESIQVVKLVSSIIYLVRPLIVRKYVNKRYKLNRKESYDIEPIKQKWNGISQHISSIVLDNADTIILTILSTMSNVSIYSVYHIVVFGVKTLLTSMTNGVQALLGEIWARKNENLLEMFRKMEWAIHTSVVLIFSCTLVLIVPFVRVYTKGVIDANYIQPIFAILLVVAHATHCLRLPYHIMIKASGRYKETQNNYICAAVINVIVSIVTVYFWGLIGVAIGTLVAMVYQTVWMALYTSKKLLNDSFCCFLKQTVVDFLCGSFISMLALWTYRIEFSSYLVWTYYACVVFAIAIAELLIINLLFYNSLIKEVVFMIINRIKNR